MWFILWENAAVKLLQLRKIKQKRKTDDANMYWKIPGLVFSRMQLKKFISKHEKNLRIWCLASFTFFANRGLWVKVFGRGRDIYFDECSKSSNGEQST